MPALDAGISFPATKKMAVSSTAMMRFGGWDRSLAPPAANGHDARSPRIQGDAIPFAIAEARVLIMAAPAITGDNPVEAPVHNPGARAAGDLSKITATETKIDINVDIGPGGACAQRRNCEQRC